MPSQAMHVEFRSGISGGLLAHYSGETRYILSVPRNGLKPVIDLMADPEAIPVAWQGRDHGPAAAYALLEEVRANLQGLRGRPVKTPFMDMIFGGSPAHESLDGTEPWSQAKTLAYYGDILAYLSVCMPDAVVVCAHLHQDERATHMHVGVLPYDAETGRVGWAQVHHRLSGLPVTRTVIRKGREVDQLTSNRAHLAGFHTQLHDQVSRHYGLDRDLGRSRSDHRARFDRDVGVVLRAAAGGYTPDYIANASPGVSARLQWAAAKGRELRHMAEDWPEGGDVDLEWEFVEAYNRAWQTEGRERLGFRPRLPGTITLEQRAVHREAVERDREDLKAARIEVEAREQAVAEREQMLDDYVEDLKYRRDRLRTRLYEVNDLKDDLKDESTRRRVKGERVTELWNSLVDKIKDPRLRQLLQPLGEGLRDLWDDSSLADLADRVAKVSEPPVPRLLKPSEFEERRGPREF